MILPKGLLFGKAPRDVSEAVCGLFVELITGRRTEEVFRWLAAALDGRRCTTDGALLVRRRGTSLNSQATSPKETEIVGALLFDMLKIKCIKSAASNRIPSIEQQQGRAA